MIPIWRVQPTADGQVVRFLIAVLASKKEAEAYAAHLRAELGPIRPDVTFVVPDPQHCPTCSCLVDLEGQCHHCAKRERARAYAAKRREQQLEARMAKAA